MRLTLWKAGQESGPELIDDSLLMMVCLHLYSLMISFLVIIVFCVFTPPRIMPAFVMDSAAGRPVSSDLQTQVLGV